MMNQSSEKVKLLQAALWYADKKGWPVLPLHSIRGGKCTCSKGPDCENPGKHPRWHKDLLPHGAQSATEDPEIIKKLWAMWPDANIGIATGERSFDALDVDLPEGPDTLRELEAKYCGLPDTVEQITGSGGRQVFFQYAGGLVGNRVKFADGLDTRSTGGLVVVPPSLHISGNRYEWEASSRPDEKELAPMSAWLLAIVKEKSSGGGGNGDGIDIAKTLNGLPKGERDQGLFRYACRLRAKGLERSEAEAIILAISAKCDPPFPPDEALKKVAQVWKKYEGPACEKDIGEDIEAHFDKDKSPPPAIEDLILPAPLFCRIEVEARRKYIDPWFQEQSIAEIVGPRGIGKSNFVLALVGAVAGGGNFGPWTCGNPERVLFIDGEMVIGDTIDRFEMLGLTSLKNLFVYSDSYMVQQGLKKASLRDEKWRVGLKGLLLKNGIKIVVFDNLSSLAPGVDENSKLEYDPINQFFLDLRFSGLSIIFVHHMGKAGSQRGTSGREDNVDAVIELKQPPGYLSNHGCRFIASFTKARIPTASLPLIADTEMRLIQVVGDCHEWAFKNAMKSTKAEVLKAFDAGVPQKDIALSLRISSSRVSQIKAEAIKEGFLSTKCKLTQHGFCHVGN
jgi:hypothetical protein